MACGKARMWAGRLAQEAVRDPQEIMFRKVLSLPHKEN